MPLVFIPAPLRRLTAGLSEVPAQGVTVRELIDDLDTRFPGLRDALCQGNALRPGLQVSIDHVMTRQGLRAGVPPHCEVHFLPLIGGG